MSKGCSFDGCLRKHLAKGYCGGHYAQWKRGHEVTTLGRRALSFAERFWQKVNKGGPEECWNWTGASIAGGYGQMWEVAGNKLAHRMSFEMAKGSIPDELVIDHMCRNPRCVNPEHLNAVTPRQNGENLGETRANNKSGVRGVHWVSRENRWAASVRSRGVRYHVGNFLDLEAARAAVVAKRIEIHTNNLLDRKAGA